MLRSFWSSTHIPPWGLFTIMATVLAIPRFYFVLNNQYTWVSLIFMFMWIMPFIFLSKTGRKSIGLVVPVHPRLLMLHFAIGASLAWVIYAAGYALFASSGQHWYAVIMESVNKNDIIGRVKGNALWFTFFVLPTLFLSPIGEEFFFRGMVHEGFKQCWPGAVATFADASFFGVTHLAHYGVIMADNTVTLLPAAPLWVVLMMLTAWTFNICRRQARSIWGAVAAHAGFNLGMMWSIVYLVHP